ncbi:hypothetical protein AGMMS49990_02390 [Endomicrobiia bacterium]|nr:hypothetical protein AGMMS49990_02390 [Endomicrobiia bacterium]
MKLKQYLSIFVAFGLVLSSCDKKNASLVNRRTATQEKIEEIKEAQRAKEEAQQKAKEEEEERKKTEAEAQQRAKEEEERKKAEAEAQQRAKEEEEEERKKAEAEAQQRAKEEEERKKAEADARHVTPDKSVNGGNAPAVISDSPLIQKLRDEGRSENEIRGFMKLENENG